MKKARVPDTMPQTQPYFFGIVLKPKLFFDMFVKKYNMKHTPNNKHLVLSRFEISTYTRI
jgi:hypothetical protein